MKTGVVQPGGLQYSMRAEVQLKAQELGIEIKDQETVKHIETLLMLEEARDGAQRILDLATDMYNQHAKAVTQMYAYLLCAARPKEEVADE